MPMFDAMVGKYRQIRSELWESAFDPELFKQQAERLCNGANSSRFSGCEEQDAQSLWHELWTKIRFAGIKSTIASKEIIDIAHVFDDFREFTKPEWNIKAKGYQVIEAGSGVNDFLNRTGRFESCQTVRNIPKLVRTIAIARKLAEFMDKKSGDTPVLQFVLGSNEKNDVRSVNAYLMNIGYTGPLTALHLMMDLGLPVVKPDIVLSRLFVTWGWLRHYAPTIPLDLTLKDLEGRGKYKSKFAYTSPTMFWPIIETSRAIVDRLEPSVLKSDIGWMTRNSLREFDIFLVKYGQEPDSQWGLSRCLARENGEFTPGDSSSLESAPCATLGANT